MEKSKILPKGTRIKFLQKLTDASPEDHREFVLAEKGDFGTIQEKANEPFYSVYWDKCIYPFGAKLGIDFEVVNLPS